MIVQLLGGTAGGYSIRIEHMAMVFYFSVQTTIAVIAETYPFDFLSRSKSQNALTSTNITYQYQPNVGSKTAKYHYQEPQLHGWCW